MIVKIMSLVSFSTTVFVSLEWFFLVLYRWRVSSEEGILCFSDGGGDYMQAAAIIHYYLEKFVNYFIYFSFSSRISCHPYTRSMLPQLRTTGIGSARDCVRVKRIQFGKKQPSRYFGRNIQEDCLESHMPDGIRCTSYIVDENEKNT